MQYDQAIVITDEQCAKCHATLKNGVTAKRNPNTGRWYHNACIDTNDEYTTNTVSPTKGLTAFTKHDSNKLDISLVPTVAINAIAAAMQYGSDKYGRNNWKQGADWLRYYNAAQRHLMAWLDGNDNDKESNLPHLYHAICNLAFLIHYADTNIGSDNRDR